MDGEASSDGEEWGFGEAEGSSKDGKKTDGMIFEDDGSGRQKRKVMDGVSQLALPVLGIAAAAALTFYVVSFSEIREKSFRDLEDSENGNGGFDSYKPLTNSCFSAESSLVTFVFSIAHAPLSTFPKSSLRSLPWPNGQQLYCFFLNGISNSIGFSENVLVLQINLLEEFHLS
ncbi:hypothetical protein V6N13_106917 [Hibiscus sabdariffa]|uniref:Uncharacterized protein n=1 Tax=Hibiscus sabdariffa TaxID=183260 RepID=A0ABR2F275_9ROSI